MSGDQERLDFEKRHASDAVEITVLTGQHTGGAGKAGGAVLWTASADVLAYRDENGSDVDASGRLSWLATDEQRDTWIHDLKPLTQYVVRARRATPDPAEYAKYGLPVPDLSHHFALDEVVERDVQNRFLLERRDQWVQPVTMSTDIGDFELDRAFGWFSGLIARDDGDISVTLAVDEPAILGAETCRATFGRLHTLVADLAAIDARWRAFAAKKLTDLANDWQDDAQDYEQEDAAPEAPITADTFAQRIRLSELSLDTEGSMTAYYDDDELFWGHAILVEVAADGTPGDATIAG
ncbi:DUF2262 domain-containing protein [Arthrobacter sp. Y-9]|uniref:DUF2262 domain-containing protein n=1 Tax=Arthrobacter sp. Y-9 TaxID=3039385 RepID=UPI00241F3962|nr:DUF2262 domain-containing protein [Arthrobacter sp. Y-9]WFR83801.1 DUF2262 domain-containing protein [Arthrobacter sp. Y-9]